MRLPIPVWLITTWFLRLWVAGVLAFGVLMVARALFSRDIELRRLSIGIISCLLWPLALLSAQGRWNLFRGIGGYR